LSDPFVIPGSDLFKPKSSSHDDIFIKPSGGGGGSPRRKSDEEIQQEADKEFEGYRKEEEKKAPVDDAPKQEIYVTVTNLRWAGEQGIYNEKSKVLGDVQIPEAHKDLTRFELSVYALDQAGKPEFIVKDDAWADKGKIEKDMPLYYPKFKVKGETPDTCQYYFTVKHRNSKLVEGPKLKVVKPEEFITLEEAQDIAFEITKEYETGGSYSKLSGNFDGAGISFGSMQWNIKWGTLQKMLTKFKKADGKAFDACFGKDTAALKTLEEVMVEKKASADDEDSDDDGVAQAFPKGMKWVETTQTNSNPPYGWKDHWEVYFKNIGDNETFQGIQKQTSIDENHKRTASKIDWMKEICPDLWAKVYLKSYCALFDLCNQHQTVRKSTRHKLQAEWKKKAPDSQSNMVETLSAAVAKAGTFSEQSLGRRMGILKGTPNSGAGWVSVGNPLLAGYLGKEKVIQGI